MRLVSSALSDRLQGTLMSVWIFTRGQKEIVDEGGLLSRPDSHNKRGSMLQDLVAELLPVRSISAFCLSLLLTLLIVRLAGRSGCARYSESPNQYHSIYDLIGYRC